MSKRNGTDSTRAAFAALFAATFMLSAFAAAEQPQLPAAIAVPDQTPIVTLHAEGAQIYECKETGRKLCLVFPRADRGANGGRPHCRAALYRPHLGEH